jgi:hypothetical protein
VGAYISLNVKKKLLHMAMTGEHIGRGQILTQVTYYVVLKYICLIEPRFLESHVF